MDLVGNMRQSSDEWKKLVDSVKKLNESYRKKSKNSQRINLVKSGLIRLGSIVFCDGIGYGFVSSLSYHEPLVNNTNVHAIISMVTLSEPSSLTYIYVNEYGEEEIGIIIKPAINKSWKELYQCEIAKFLNKYELPIPKNDFLLAGDSSNTHYIQQYQKVIPKHILFNDNYSEWLYKEEIEKLI